MSQPDVSEGGNYASFYSRTRLTVTKHSPKSPYGEKVVINNGGPSIDIPADQITELIEMLTAARDWKGV